MRQNGGGVEVGRGDEGTIVEVVQHTYKAFYLLPIPQHNTVSLSKAHS